MRLGVELAIDEVWPDLKVEGWRKGAGSKIAVGPPIPIYIASDRISSQHVGVGLAQAHPNQNPQLLQIRERSDQRRSDVET